MYNERYVADEDEPVGGSDNRAISPREASGPELI
jgi:hypothetical protein